MKKRWVVTLLLSMFLIGIDQFTKYFFYNQEIGSELFFLEPLLNDGISRGMSMPMIAILLVSIICILLFAYLFHKRYLTVVDFSLLIAGTIGNLIDRIWLGGVRDFLSFGSFPVFNIADAFLTCGVAWICIKEIFHLQNK